MNEAVAYETIKVRDVGTVRVIELVDSRILDEERIHLFGEELLEACRQHEGNVVVNLRNVGFVSSTCFGKFTHLEKLGRVKQIKILLCSIQPDVLLMMELSGLIRLFQVYPDEQEALTQAKKA